MRYQEHQKGIKYTKKTIKSPNSIRGVSIICVCVCVIGVIAEKHYLCELSPRLI